nr:hypothetical protein [uncultured Allomuricauda sp.]
MQAKPLTHIEIFFLKKYASGIPIDEIKKDLNIESNEDFILKKEVIKLKLDITNDLDLINKAFDLGLLVVDDHILKNINHIVFGIAYNVYIYSKRNKNSQKSLSNLYRKVFNTYLCVLQTQKM